MKRCWLLTLVGCSLVVAGAWLYRHADDEPVGAHDPYPKHWFTLEGTSSP